MALRINVLRYNRFVFAFLVRTTPSPSGSYDSQAGRQNMAGILNLVKPLQVELFGFLLCL